MLNEIESMQHKFDYAFIPRKYHVEKHSIPPSSLLGLDLGESGLEFNSVNFGSNTHRQKKKDLFTISDFVFFDLAKKEIILRKKLVEKRSVWGDSDYTWTGILTTDEWKKEWEKNQTDKKLDKNAQSIRKKWKEKSPNVLE